MDGQAKVVACSFDYDEVLVLMVIAAFAVVSIGMRQREKGAIGASSCTRKVNPGLGFRGRELGRFPQIDELGTAGQFEQLGSGSPRLISVTSKFCVPKRDLGAY